MNWRITTTAKKLKDAELTVDHAEADDPKAKPDPELVKAARAAVDQVAAKLGGKDLHVEINAHETTKGRGFRPGHVVITVSRLDPKRDK